MRNLSGVMLVLVVGMATLFYKQPGGAPAGPKAGSDSARSRNIEAPAATGVMPQEWFDQSDTFLIVMVPDLETTGLNLLFDRWLESVQDGARLQGYLGERYWLPKGKRSAKEPLAGILSYWRNEDRKRLSVLLVGESPVSGVDRAGLEFALGRSLERAGKLAAIVGPAFSGSYHGLGGILDDIAKKGTGESRWRLISGSATNEGAAAQFKVIHAAVDAQRAIEDDDRALCTFASFFQSRSLIRQNYLVLGESATAYGAGATAEPCKGRSKFVARAFPRDIAQLRAAYGSSDAAAGGASNPLRGPGIRPARTESESASDAPPMQAAGQTLATQDANLRALADSFRDSSIKWFTTRATNPLDNVFLREFFQREAAQLNLVLTDTDPLFSYSPESQSFFGSFAVSSNQPFFSPADAELESSTADLEGKSKLSFGITNAVFRGLGDAAPLSDLTPQRVWISIVGTHGYWPIAWTKILSDAAKPDASIDSSLPGELLQANQAFRYFPKVSLLVAVLIAFFVLREGWLFLSLYRNVIRDFMKPTSELAISGFYHLKLICVTGFFTALALTQFVIVAPAKALSGGEILIIGLLELMGWVSLLIAALALVLFLRRRAVDWGAYCIEGLVVAGALVFAIDFVKLVYGERDGLVSFFFNYRAVHFESGVSPALPIVFVMLSLAVCGRVQFGRFDLAELASVKLLTLKPEALRKAQVDVSNVIDWMYTPSSLMVFLAVLSFFGIFGLMKSEPLSIEGNGYDRLILLVLTLSSALISGSLMIFWQAWRRLQAMLDLIEHTPIRVIFARLPADLGSLAVFHGLSRERSLVFLDRSRDSWLRLGEACKWKQLTEYVDLTEKIQNAMTKLELTEGRHQRDHECQRIALQKNYDSCLEMIQNAFPTLWVDDVPDLKTDATSERNLDLAREFVAFRLLSFIRYSMIQLREQFSYFGGAFLLQVVALSSYPFLATTSVKNYLFVTFLLLAGCLTYALWQMGRNAILQKLSSDDKSSGNPVLWQSLQVGALPVIGFLGAYFPSLGNLLFSWVYPALEKLH